MQTPFYNNLYKFNSDSIISLFISAVKKFVKYFFSAIGDFGEWTMFEIQVLRCIVCFIWVIGGLVYLDEWNLMWVGDEK